jgi:flotillin
MSGPYAIEQAAEAVRLRGLAEAEAKEKLAEAFAKFGEAAVLDIIVKMLPELAGKIAEPLKSIDKLTVVDTGNGEGAARVSNYVTSLMATAPEMLKSVTGIDLEQLVKGLTQKQHKISTKTIIKNDSVNKELS